MDEMLRLYKERARLLGLEMTASRELSLARNKKEILELRHNENHDPASGRFTSGGGGGRMGKTKYARSPRANARGVTVSVKKFGQLRGDFNTHYPNAKPEDGPKYLYDSRYRYRVTADGSGSIIINSRHKIEK